MAAGAEVNNSDADEIEGDALESHAQNNRLGEAQGATLAAACEVARAA